MLWKALTTLCHSPQHSETPVITLKLQHSWDSTDWLDLWTSFIHLCINSTSMYWALTYGPDIVLNVLYICTFRVPSFRLPRSNQGMNITAPTPRIHNSHLPSIVGKGARTTDSIPSIYRPLWTDPYLSVVFPTSTLGSLVLTLSLQSHSLIYLLCTAEWCLAESNIPGSGQQYTHLSLWLWHWSVAAPLACMWPMSLGSM